MYLSSLYGCFYSICVTLVQSIHKTNGIGTIQEIKYGILITLNS